MESFNLRDAIRRGARLRVVVDSELPSEFRSDLLHALEGEPNVMGAWLAWITWPNQPSELLLSVLLGHADPTSFQQVLARAAALDGPRCVGLLPAVAPDGVAFYKRAHRDGGLTPLGD